MFERPQELGAEQPADDTDERGIDAFTRQVRPAQLSLQHPESDEHSQRHEHTETGDLELADSEKDGVDGASLYLGRAAAKPGRTDCAR